MHKGNIYNESYDARLESEITCFYQIYIKIHCYSVTKSYLILQNPKDLQQTIRATVLGNGHTFLDFTSKTPQQVLTVKIWERTTLVLTGEGKSNICNNY